MDEIFTTLKSLPKELLEWIIFQLMLDGKIEYHDLTDMHIRHLETLRKGQSEHYRALVHQITEMHLDGKGKLKKNMGGILRYLRTQGEINITHEEIDKKYGKRQTE